MAEVLVFAEHAGGEVKKVSTELLTLARRHGEPAVVWTGPGAEAGRDRLAEFGAARVYVADGAEFDEYVAAPRAEAVAAAVAQASPAAVLVAGTTEGKEVAARLAVKTGSGVIADALDLGEGLVAEQSIFGGSIVVHSRVRTGTPIIAVRPNAVTPQPAPPWTPRNPPWLRLKGVWRRPERRRRRQARCRSRSKSPAPGPTGPLRGLRGPARLWPWRN